MKERYSYFDEFYAHFHINTEPECAAKYNLNRKNQTLMLFVKESEHRQNPFVLTKEKFNTNDILEFINLSVTRSLPRWN